MMHYPKGGVMTTNFRPIDTFQISFSRIDESLLFNTALIALGCPHNEAAGNTR